MAIAVYTTDLIDIDLATDATNWAESSATDWKDLSTQAYGDTDDYVEGTVSHSSQVKSGVGMLMVDSVSGITIPTDGAVLIWAKWDVIPSLEDESAGGVRFAIGDSLSDFYAYNHFGGDTYPYGKGWSSLANADPSNLTADFTIGSPTTTRQFFGWAYYALTVPAKGNPYKVDAVRYGRCELRANGGDVSNGYATFTGMAFKNDANDATNGYNRWGLFQETGGDTYLWKGLITLGYTSAIDFRDSNKTIIIDDTKQVTDGFNKLEIRQATSNIEWVSISITKAGLLSKGIFNVVDNATISKKSCTFTDMDWFTYQSNSTIENTTYRRCGLVTQGGSTFTGDTFDEASGAIALSVDDIDLITKCQFNSDGTGHAVDLGNFAADDSVSWDNLTNGYASTDGTTGNETILVDVDSGFTLTISVASTGTVPTIYNTGLGTVTVVTGQITVKVTVYDDSTGLPLQYARVQLNKDSDQSQILSAETDVNGVVSTTLSYTVDIPVHGWARQWDLSGDDYTPKNIGGTIDSGGLTIDVRLTPI